MSIIIIIIIIFITSFDKQSLQQNYLNGRLPENKCSTSWPPIENKCTYLSKTQEIQHKGKSKLRKTSKAP